MPESRSLLPSLQNRANCQVVGDCLRGEEGRNTQKKKRKKESQFVEILGEDSTRTFANYANFPDSDSSDFHFKKDVRHSSNQGSIFAALGVTLGETARRSAPVLFIYTNHIHFLLNYP